MNKFFNPGDMVQLLPDCIELLRIEYVGTLIVIQEDHKFPIVRRSTEKTPGGWLPADTDYFELVTITEDQYEYV